MGGSTGGFPVELILFGGIAAFLILRLRSILGRRHGFEQPPAEPQASNVVDLRAAGAPRPPPPATDAVAEPSGTARIVPPPSSPAGLVLARMQLVERSFSPARFLDGAQAAFGLIVRAFAAGDRATLRPLLTEATFAAFEGAIAAREAAGQTQRTEIRSLESLGIETAELRDEAASITVRVVSDQVNVTIGSDGLPVAGADAVTEMTDLWTFERRLGHPDPAWRLAAARSA